MIAAPDSVTVAFVGYATAAMSARAAAFEDEVLEILASHGGTVLYRGRRGDGQDEALPFEVQLLSFPDRAALAAYVADERRRKLISSHGDVFTVKHAVELVTIAPR